MNLTNELYQARLDHAKTKAYLLKVTNDLAVLKSEMYANLVDQKNNGHYKVQALITIEPMVKKLQNEVAEAENNNYLAWIEVEKYKTLLNITKDYYYEEEL